jgi:hypothetical protein
MSNNRRRNGISRFLRAEFSDVRRGMIHDTAPPTRCVEQTSELFSSSVAHGLPGDGRRGKISGVRTLRDHESGRSRHSTWAPLITAVLLLYLVPLFVVLIDELVLRTCWLARHFPDGSRAVFYTVYPFVEWFVPYLRPAQLETTFRRGLAGEADAADGRCRRPCWDRCAREKTIASRSLAAGECAHLIPRRGVEPLSAP